MTALTHLHIDGGTTASLLINRYFPRFPNSITDIQDCRGYPQTSSAQRIGTHPIPKGHQR